MLVLAANGSGKEGDPSRSEGPRVGLVTSPEFQQLGGNQASYPGRVRWLKTVDEDGRRGETKSGAMITVAAVSGTFCLVLGPSRSVHGLTLAHVTQSEPLNLGLYSLQRMECQSTLNGLLVTSCSWIRIVEAGEG